MRHAGGLKDPDKCSWAATGDRSPDNLQVDGAAAMQQVSELHILGRVFNLRSLEEYTVEDRVSKAWKVCWGHRRQFRCSKASVVLRMRPLHAVVSPTPLWGLTTIDPAKAVLDKVRHTQQNSTQTFRSLQTA